jgi:hypothetical protein
MMAMKICLLCERAAELDSRVGNYYCKHCIDSRPELFTEFFISDKPQKPISPDIRARISFFLQQDGGRDTSVYPPFYSCPLKIENIDDSLHDCRIYYEKPIAPGETAEVCISFLSLELFADKLFVGQKFEIYENRIVGEGEITEMLFV